MLDKLLGMNTPWIESPFFETILQEKEISAEYKELCRSFNTNGFVILKNVISKESADQLINDINEYFPDKIDLETNRRQDLWQEVGSVKSLATNEKVLEILNLFYQREPIPFQTLNFKYGSQQKIHSDDIHFSSIPERFMCGVWVALEDTNEKNGPLIYYPKSHKEKQYSYFDIGIQEDSPGMGDGLKKGSGYQSYHQYESFVEKLTKVKNYERKELYLEKGDVLIWASNLLHGGKVVLDESLTRWSQVTHYYFENCFYYTPMWSRKETGELYVRTPHDIKSGNKIEGSLNGVKLDSLYVGNGRKINVSKVDPSLLKGMTWRKISILIKDRIKTQFS